MIDPRKECLQDLRSPALTRHSLGQLMRQRVYQMAAGNEGCNDASAVR
ncbi:MAG: hypothetical protein FJ128_04305 [Deltaproteobacteria bacterium]|nr:hypothetical protein [Deltaproteobacteria bacterium]